MVLKEVPNITPEQANFIHVLTNDLSDSLSLKIEDRKDQLSKTEASIAIQYLLWRRGEKNTGVNLVELVEDGSK